LAIAYSNLSTTEDATLAISEAEPDAGDITLEVTDEEITDVKIAPVVEQPDFWGVLGPAGWLAYELADVMTPQTVFTEPRVQTKTTDSGGKWVYTGMTPETFSTNQKLVSQEALHQQLRNPASDYATRLDLKDLLGEFPTDTSEEKTDGGLLSGISDLFGGLGEGTDWTTLIIVAVVAIVVIMLVMSMARG